MPRSRLDLTNRRVNVDVDSTLKNICPPDDHFQRRIVVYSTSRRRLRVFHVAVPVGSAISYLYRII